MVKVFLQQKNIDLQKLNKYATIKKVNICESEDLIWHLTETTSPKTESGE